MSVLDGDLPSSTYLPMSEVLGSDGGREAEPVFSYDFLINDCFADLVDDDGCGSFASLLFLKAALR